MSHDLRGFLDRLKTHRPHDFVVVEKEVDPDEEAIALVRNLEARAQYPVVRFNKIRGAAGPVVMNLHASEERLAFALDTTREKLNETYAHRLQQLVPPVLRDNGPVQDCVIPEADVDLRKLPILTPFADCPAPYISGGIMVVKDCETGIRNLSYIRLMVTGPRTMTMNAAPFQHTDIIIRNAEKRGLTCRAAIFIGYHPAIGLGALAKVPFNIDEYDCCGALLRQPVELVRCQSADLEVPAAAEMVIEVEIFQKERVSEGPYGEFTGYALPAELQPVVHVRCITHRRDPIYQDVVAGGREHLLMGKIPKESTQEGFLRGMFPMVRRVHMPFSGRGRFHMVLSIGSHRPADVRRLIIAAFVNDHFIKHVFVVDENVNVEDDAEVLWALSTCFQGDRDLVVIEKMPGSSLDPSGYEGATGTKLGFDCTRKGAKFPPRFQMNPAIAARMRPEDFIASMP